LRADYEQSPPPPTLGFYHFGASVTSTTDCQEVGRRPNSSSNLLERTPSRCLITRCPRTAAYRHGRFRSNIIPTVVSYKLWSFSFVHRSTVPGTVYSTWYSAVPVARVNEPWSKSCFAGTRSKSQSKVDLFAFL
jgi:hypothetical protein